MLEQILKKFRDEPVEFVRKILHAEPDEWQAEALNALARRPRIAIRSGHGVGKTALESWAICWFLFTRPFCKVPCTAPTRDQVNNILWSEISKWLKRSELLTELFEWQKTKICFRAQPERWAALAKSAARPENMAGFHEDHLLFGKVYRLNPPKLTFSDTVIGMIFSTSNRGQYADCRTLNFRSIVSLSSTGLTSFVVILTATTEKYTIFNWS